MYLGPANSPKNHKHGYCLDGVKQKAKTLPWLQPDSIFSIGTSIFPLVFLKFVGELYEKVLGDNNWTQEFLMEEEAFPSLLQQRMQNCSDGSIFFELLDLEVPTNTPSSLIVEEADTKFLRVDILCTQ